MRWISPWRLVSVGALLACSAQAEAQRRLYTSSDGNIPITKGAPQPSQISHVSVKGAETTVKIPPVMPAQPFRLVDYLDFNEQNLTYYMATRDTLEARLATIAQQKASDVRVRDIAAIISGDRNNRAAKVTEIIVDENIGTEAPARDFELGRLHELVEHFSKLPAGPGFDAAYLRSVFFLHQNEIDVLSANLKNAHDDDFERLIEDSIRSMTQTREVVRTVSQAMGVSLP